MLSVSAFFDFVVQTSIEISAFTQSVNFRYDGEDTADAALVGAPRGIGWFVCAAEVLLEKLVNAGGPQIVSDDDLRGHISSVFPTIKAMAVRDTDSVQNKYIRFVRESGCLNSRPVDKL